MKKVLTLLTITLAALTSCKPEEEEIIPPEPQVVYLDVYYDEIVFPSNGGEDSFVIDSNTDWAIANDADWLTIEPTEGNGYCSITLTASASDLYDDRNTVITVKAGDKTETFTVTQKYAEALLVTKNKFDITQEGGEFTVEVQSNISYDIVIAEESQSWITEVPTSKALNTYTHLFSVESNPNATKRDGSIEIIGSNGKTETINIYQAQKDELVLSKSEETVPAKGGEVRVQLRSNVDYEVIVPEDVDWVEQIQSDKADELIFNVKPNDKTEEREVGITVKDKNSDLSQIFTIKQIVGSIILEESYFEVDARGGSIEVTLSTDIDFEVIIPENIDWVKTIETKSLTDSTFYLSVLPNSLTEEREAEITVKDVNSDVAQTLTIKQKVGQIIVKQTEFEVQFKGETISIPYSSDIECKVIIPESVQSWISIVETKSMESHSVQLSIALNEETNERAATITIQDINSPLSQDIKITQMAFGYYKGDIRATSEEDIKEIHDAGYKVIDGNVYFAWVETLTELDNIIEEITGNLEIAYDITSLDGLYGLKKIGGDLIMENDDLISFEGLNNLESIGGNFKIYSLWSNNDGVTLKPLKKLESIGGNMVLSLIKKLEWPENLSQIGDSLILHKVVSCQGLTNINHLKNLKASGIYSFEGLNNLTSISGNLHCIDCSITDFSGLNNLQAIGGDFTLEASYFSFNELTSFAGLNNLREIGGDFILDAYLPYNDEMSAFRKLENFNGLQNLKAIKGAFKITSRSYGGSIFHSLSSFYGLTHLTSIGGGFFIISENAPGVDCLYGLESLRGLDNLSEVNGDFVINFDEHNNHTILIFSDGPKNLSLIDGDFRIHQQGYYENNNMDCFIGLKTVNGNMELENVDTVGLSNLAYIGGSLVITNADTLGMSSLATIGGDFKVSGGYANVNGLTGLNTINGNLSINETSMTAINGIAQLQKVGGDIEISDNSKLEDISGFIGLTSCANISITNSPKLYNFQPLETAVKNMTGTWYVYGCGYNPTKYQMLNGESKPQE